MSEEAKKDVNQRLRTVSYGGFVVSEKGFDQLDESAKRISTNISKKNRIRKIPRNRILNQMILLDRELKSRKMQSLMKFMKMKAIQMI